MRRGNATADGGFDHDVAVVGGGPAGCSAAVFTARAGLDTVVFDRGRSSLKRCAYLENYLGFPDGIDIETLYDLFHEHVETVGGEIVPDLIESVERCDGGFVLERDEGESVTARRVIAAARYDGEYMRGLDDEEAMFETYEDGGEEHAYFEREYADFDGGTPVDGLYVASPSSEADEQAIIAAGRGARVGRRVAADARADDGWWETVADDVDWVRREDALDEEFADREAWVEWFDDHYGEEAPVDPDSERFERVREAFIDRRCATYLDADEIESRAETGHETLAAHLDEDTLAAALDPETVAEEMEERRLLDAMDDSTVREYAETAMQAGGQP